jgi:hypothetical protein
VIWPAAEAVYFCARGWTDSISLIRLNNFRWPRSAKTEQLDARCRRRTRGGESWQSTLGERRPVCRNVTSADIA